MASTGTLHDFFKPAGATALADQLERQISRADAADERAVFGLGGSFSIFIPLSGEPSKNHFAFGVVVHLYVFRKAGGLMGPLRVSALHSQQKWLGFLPTCAHNSPFRV